MTDLNVNCLEDVYDEDVNALRLDAVRQRFDLATAELKTYDTNKKLPKGVVRVLHFKKTDPDDVLVACGVCGKGWLHGNPFPMYSSKSHCLGHECREAWLTRRIPCEFIALERGISFDCGDYSKGRCQELRLPTKEKAMYYILSGEVKKLYHDYVKQRDAPVSSGCCSFVTLGMRHDDVHLYA